MEAKLKALKVVELKELLHKANVAIPARANKPDLIAKIIASPEAIALFNGQDPSQTQTQPVPAPAKVEPVIESPPSPVPHTMPDVSEQQTPSAVPPPKPSAITDQPSQDAPAPSTTSATTDAPSADAPTTTPAPANEDEEAAKRRKRAERFGIPYVEPKKQQQPKVKDNNKQKNAKAVNGNSTVKNNAASAKPTAKVPEDPDKLKQRAARFNITKPNTSASDNKAAASELGKGKRAAPSTEEVDAEEIERRKKRALRFGLKT